MGTALARTRTGLVAAGGLALLWQGSFLVVPFRAAGEHCAPAVVSVWQGDNASVQQDGPPPGTAVADLAGILAPAGCGTAAAGRMADHGGLAVLAVVLLAVLDLTSGVRHEDRADRGDDGFDGVADRRAEAESRSKVFALDAEDDEPVGEPVENPGERDGVAGAEPVRGGRPRLRLGGSTGHTVRSAGALVDLYPVHVARGGKVRMDGVDHDRDRKAGPEVEQPGGLAVVLDRGDAR